MEIKNWQSVTDYDAELKGIEHYKIHSEMLPYVGKNYKKAKILLVGEDHALTNTAVTTITPFLISVRPHCHYE